MASKLLHYYYISNCKLNVQVGPEIFDASKNLLQKFVIGIREFDSDYSVS